MELLDLSPAPKKRGKPPRHLADLTLAERRTLVTEAGLPAFRADQVSKHYFGRLTADPAEMTDLPAGLRDEIARTLLPTLVTPVSEKTADDGETRKTLWRANDGSLVESVLMRYPDRATVCVS